MYWPTSIKDTIQRFPFLINMEHIENILNPNKGLILSFLEVFAMFKLCLSDDEEVEEIIATRCINCKKETGLYLIDPTVEYTITNFCQMQYCIMWVCHG